jgi:BirA family biotin operon repressor/biotin-[acetyl-CoA-carboxylase] ligase
VTIWLRSTTSTMTDAAALALRGEPHGTVVVAEEQTGGVGRHGSAWHSEYGSGLYMSVILRLPLGSSDLPVLTMAIGLAVQRALEETAHVSCDIRWPNDLMLNGKKVCGSMAQMTDKGVIIAGIGVNMNQTAFPDELQLIATSLRIETGREHSREELLDRIAAECMHYTALLAESGKPTILRQFEEHSSYARGKAVEVDGRIRGVTAGLTDDGFLLVETPAGVETILTGGIRAITSSEAR